MNHTNVSRSSGICVEDPNKDGHGEQLYGMKDISYGENVRGVAFPDLVKNKYMSLSIQWKLPANDFFQESSSENEYGANLKYSRENHSCFRYDANIFNFE